MTLHIVCAWCRSVLKAGSPGAATTHGICESCIERFEAS